VFKDIDFSPIYTCFITFLSIENLDFETAIKLRDKILGLQKKFLEK